MSFQNGFTRILPRSDYERLLNQAAALLRMAACVQIRETLSASVSEL
jgi:hypothetical protein